MCAKSQLRDTTANRAGGHADSKILMRNQSKALRPYAGESAGTQKEKKKGSKTVAMVAAAAAKSESRAAAANVNEFELEKSHMHAHAHD